MEERVKRRDQLDIIASILETLLKREPATKTRVAYTAYIDFKRAERHLDLLEKMGFIGKGERKGRTVYYITEKGKLFLADYKGVKETR